MVLESLRFGLERALSLLEIVFSFHLQFLLLLDLTDLCTEQLTTMTRAKANLPAAPDLLRRSFLLQSETSVCICALEGYFPSS